MFQFFKNLFKKKKEFNPDKIKERLAILNTQRGVEVNKIEDNMYSIEVDGDMSNLSIIDILKIIEGK